MLWIPTRGNWVSSGPRGLRSYARVAPDKAFFSHALPDAYTAVIGCAVEHPFPPPPPPPPPPPLVGSVCSTRLLPTQPLAASNSSIQTCSNDLWNPTLAQMSKGVHSLLVKTYRDAISMRRATDGCVVNRM